MTVSTGANGPVLPTSKRGVRGLPDESQTIDNTSRVINRADFATYQEALAAKAEEKATTLSWVQSSSSVRLIRLFLNKWQLSTSVWAGQSGFCSTTVWRVFLSLKTRSELIQKPPWPNWSSGESSQSC